MRICRLKCIVRFLQHFEQQNVFSSWQLECYRIRNYGRYTVSPRWWLLNARKFSFKNRIAVDLRRREYSNSIGKASCDHVRAIFYLRLENYGFRVWIIWHSYRGFDFWSTKFGICSIQTWNYKSSIVLHFLFSLFEARNSSKIRSIELKLTILI